MTGWGVDMDTLRLAGVAFFFSPCGSDISLSFSFAGVFGAGSKGSATDAESKFEVSSLPAASRVKSSSSIRSRSS